MHRYYTHNLLISHMIKGCKEKFFINQIFDENIRRLHQGKKFFGKKMQLNWRKNGPKCNLVSKILIIIIYINLFYFILFKLLLLFFFFNKYVLYLISFISYQHDSKDFNICNYKHNLFSFTLNPLWPELFFPSIFMI